MERAPKVGVAVFVVENGKFLMGKRKGSSGLIKPQQSLNIGLLFHHFVSIGEGTFGLPGGKVVLKTK